MMTEEEARKKRGYHNGCGEFRIVNGEAKNFCIASECMAWRWANGTSWRVWGVEAGDFDALEEAKKNPANRRGFCGLAGVP